MMETKRPPFLFLGEWYGSPSFAELVEAKLMLITNAGNASQIMPQLPEFPAGKVVGRLADVRHRQRTWIR